MSVRRAAVVVFSVFLVAFCLTNMFQGMRGIMRLGGMVASGGPYAIAHPAPTWALILPASFMVAMITSLLHLFFLSSGEGVIPLILLFWSGIFLPGGYNFLAFTVSPPEGFGFPWGWLICGILFAAMGLAPLLWVGSTVVRAMCGKELVEPERPAGRSGKGASPGPFLLLQLAAIPAGIVVSVLFFRAIAG